MSIIITKENCPENHPCPVINVCPTKALSQDGFKAPTVNNDKCIDCNKCIFFCGYGAFQVNYSREIRSKESA